MTNMYIHDVYVHIYTHHKTRSITQNYFVLELCGIALANLYVLICSVGTIMSTAVIRAMFFKLEESSAYRVKKTLHRVVKTRLCSQATEVNKRQPLHVCLCTLKASQRRLLRQDNRLQCVVSLHDNFSKLSYVKHL